MSFRTARIWADPALLQPMVSHLRAVPTIICKGVRSDDERHEQMKSSLARGYDKLKIEAPHNKRLDLCCYGPSLADSWKEISGDTMTISGAHGFIANHYKLPDFHLECDPRNDKIPYIKPSYEQTTYLMASVCHPQMFDALEGKSVKLWHCFNNESDESVIKDLDPGNFLLRAGSTAGLCAIAVAYTMGYRDVHVHGMDSSSPVPNKRHAGDHYGKWQSTMRVTSEEDGKGEWFWTTAQMISAVNEFFELPYRLPGIKVTLHGHGLLQHKVRLSIEKAKAEGHSPESHPIALCPTKI